MKITTTRKVTYDQNLAALIFTRPRYKSTPGQRAAWEEAEKEIAMRQMYLLEIHLGTTMEAVFTDQEPEPYEIHVGLITNPDDLPADPATAAIPLPLPTMENPAWAIVESRGPGGTFGGANVPVYRNEDGLLDLWL